jgi:hypothetical protein
MTDEHTDEQAEAAEYWLTYAQAAQAMGLTVEAVRSIARRQKWPRRSPNAVGGQAWVLVPAERLTDGHSMPPPASAMTSAATGKFTLTLDQLPLPVERPAQTVEHTDERLSSIDRQLAELLTTVQEQLTVERECADRAEQRVQVAERRLVEMQGMIDELTAGHTDERGKLLDELAEQRRITMMLVEQLARRRWWRWRSR